MTPSPGDYEPKKDFIKPKIMGVSFTKSGKTPTRKVQSFRSQWLESPQKDNPSAGEYDTNKSIVITKPSIPGFRIKEE